MVGAEGTPMVGTLSSSLGSSTVDYFITDPNPESLRAFTVSQMTRLSD
jgi:hypothetical protein